MTEEDMTPSAFAGSIDANFLSSFRARIDTLETGDEKLKDVYADLKRIEEDEEKATQMNAKLKRSLKRLIETCLKKIEGESIQNYIDNTSETIDAPLAVVDPKTASEKLRVAQCQQDVDRILNCIDIAAVKTNYEASALQPLKDTLSLLVSPAQLLDRPLKKITRRRVNRFVYALSSAKERAIIDTQTKAGIADERKVKAGIAPKSSSALLSSDASVPNLILKKKMELLDHSEDPDDIERHINDINAHINNEIQGDIPVNFRPNLAKIIDSILASDKRKGPSRLRRKLRRLYATVAPNGESEEALVKSEFGLHSSQQSSNLSPSSSSKSASNSMDDLHNKSLSQCFEQLSNATTSSDVEEAVRNVSVKSIQANDVNEEECNKLKNLISNLLGGSHEINLILQSSQRRKLKRLLDNLGGDSGTVVLEAARDDRSAKRLKITPAKTEENLHNEDDFAENHQPKPIPYVVFVGQLAFSTTKEKIESFFRDEGNVDGDIRVRLLTHKQNERSKGMAFVQVEGSRELRKCLEMHQSCLDGRIINVEHSRGKKGKSQHGVSMVDESVKKVAARSKIMFAPPPLGPGSS